jgi:hypothetical protein
MGILLGDRELVLQPRFSIRVGENGVAYTSEISEQCGFIGWVPYSIKRWEISSDKLAFKRYCESVGVRTPMLLDENKASEKDFIIKPRKGSFSNGIRGPFRFCNHGDHRNGIDEFREEYISGKIMKAWYWCGSVVAVEVMENPVIFGDGIKSIDQIIAARRGSFDAELDAEGIEPILEWQSTSRGSIPEAGSEVRLDFRYRSPFFANSFKDLDCLAELEPGVREQLENAGPLLFMGIDKPVRPFSMFTLDAILGEDGMIYFLEMNSSPMVHPKIYPTMLSNIFQENAVQREHANPTTVA